MKSPIRTRSYLTMALTAGVVTALAGAAGAAKPKPPKGPITGEAIGSHAPARVDLVIAIDGTGSMFDEIGKAKDTALGYIDAYAKSDPPADLRVGLVVYRDKGDDRRVEAYELNADLDATRGLIKGIDASGGGDRPESVWFGLQVAIRGMKWDTDKNTAKSVVVIGDAPPKFYKGEATLSELAVEAKSKNIVLSACAITKAGDTIEEFARIAKLGGGSFEAIDPPPRRDDMPRPKPTVGSDVVFVVDTTGSMGGAITDVRAKVHSLAKAMSEDGSSGDSALQESTEVRFGLVDYRDRGDEWVALMRTSLTGDLPKFLAEVDKLEAGGGGDYPESVIKALQVALHPGMGWADGGRKAIVLIGDAIPSIYAGEPTIEAMAHEAAKKKIAINAVSCGGSDLEAVWRMLAKVTGGDFYMIADLGKAVDSSIGSGGGAK